MPAGDPGPRRRAPPAPPAADGRHASAPGHAASGHRAAGGDPGDVDRVPGGPWNPPCTVRPPGKRHPAGGWPSGWRSPVGSLLPSPSLLGPRIIERGGGCLLALVGAVRRPLTPTRSLRQREFASPFSPGEGGRRPDEGCGRHHQRSAFRQRLTSPAAPSSPPSRGERVAASPAMLRIRRELPSRSRSLTPPGVSHGQERTRGRQIRPNPLGRTTAAEFRSRAR